ncbi:MAG: hypothetical protein QOJ32_3128, partial [Frankiaceae bacterium]|nr:hypothetical protein [Frankiaceae bacterium]
MDESACTPGSVPAATEAAAATAIYLGLPLPTASSGLPAGSGGPPSNACAAPPVARLRLLDLAPGGVYLAVRVAPDAGALLPHRFTLTSSPKRGGGLFSVALSRGSPRVGVTHHLALWSPDVPRRGTKSHDATVRPARPP